MIALQAVRVPVDVVPSAPESPDLCAESAFSPSLPLSFVTGTSYPFTVDFGTAIGSITKVTAISSFAPNDTFDRGDRYFMDTFGGQESTADTNATTQTLIQMDPAVLREFLDGLFGGSYISEAGRFTLTSLRFCVREGPAETAVSVDIKPGSCPNPLNVKAHGVFPVAIVGMPAFDVTQIDPSSVRLEGVVPVRYAYEDVATPHVLSGNESNPRDCTTAGPDGFTDLTLKFDIGALVRALGPVTDREIRTLRVSCSLKPAFGALSLTGQDFVVVLAR